MITEQLKTTSAIIQKHIEVPNKFSKLSSLINEMKLIHYRNELVRRGISLEEDRKPREIFVHSISAHEAIGHLKYSSKMNTSWEFLLDLKQKGREYAEKWIINEYDQVGIKSSFDVEKHFFNKFK